MAAYLNHSAITLDEGLVESFDVLSRLLRGLVAGKLHFLGNLHSLPLDNR